jgi:hypothetical protein
VRLATTRPSVFTAVLCSVYSAGQRGDGSCGGRQTLEAVADSLEEAATDWWQVQSTARTAALPSFESLQRCIVTVCLRLPSFVSSPHRSPHPRQELVVSKSLFISD